MTKRAITSEEALKRLKEGNSRFVAGQSRQQADRYRSQLADLIGGQHPFAIILGCSDSRVPPEIIFDQGVGDLFIVRVAGNIAEPAALGSIEYAAEYLGARLIVVLGHASCGAVQAALAQLDSPGQVGSPYLQSILDHIHPAVAALPKVSGQEPQSVVDEAIGANIRASLEQIGNDSPILKRLMETNDLESVGAQFSLDTGTVEFM